MWVTKYAFMQFLSFLSAFLCTQTLHFGEQLEPKISNCRNNAASYPNIPADYNCACVCVHTCMCSGSVISLCQGDDDGWKTRCLVY